MLTGCGDSADSLLRTGVNYKSELTDRLMKVTDEASAKKFIDHHMKVFSEKNKNLNDKWDKWIKEIEDDYRGKVRVINIKSTAAPGTDEWEQDMLNAERKKDDDRIINTREAFISYMKKITADTARFDRERARIGDIVKHLVGEERAKGTDNPNPVELWPNLVKITEPDSFKNVLLTGAVKKVVRTE
jgi:hypothetical protein